MGLSGPWPYLLFLALDGAAGVCAVLLARRAARGGASMAPRLAVWGLVGASAAFNYTHAPQRPDAPEAYALMPVVAAVLFEFCLQETRSRAAARPGRRLGILRWLHPGERVRVGIRMSADEALSAADATRYVRVESAARSLYRLRGVIGQQDGGTAVPLASRRARRALRRAHAALERAGFADEPVAADVLRRVQVMTMTESLASLDYASAEEAYAAIRNMIARGPVPDAERGELAAPPAGPAARCAPDSTQETACTPEQPKPTGDFPPSEGETAHADDPGSEAGPAPESPAGRDAELVEAARQIVAGASLEGTRLSQAALAERLRQQGWSIANHRLSWLAATIGLSPHRA
jgi:hypothetical protein